MTIKTWRPEFKTIEYDYGTYTVYVKIEDLPTPALGKPLLLSLE
jgi:hypothetical protein